MAGLAGVLLALTALTACGGDEEKADARIDLPTETPALWNPCDALDVAFIEKHFGAATTKNAGSPTKPQCRFAPPQDSGDPVVTANYLLFPGTLEDAWATMGQPEDADVRRPRIADADDARIVVSVVEDQLYVTGFVQDGDLIQQVDLVDPAPFAKPRAIKGVQATLAQLSAHADESGVGEASPAAEPTSEGS